MSLQEQVQEETKAAMRARDKARVGTLRMLSSALQDAEIAQGGDLSEADELAVVQKLIKQRRDAVEQYRAGGREEQAAAEETEVGVLQELLPASMSAEDVNEAIDAAITEVGAQSPQDMGKVMGLLKERLQGRADMGQVSQQVKERLAS